MTAKESIVVDGLPKQPKGLKYDDDKLDWALLPILATEETLKVLMEGAKKYERHNWLFVSDHKRRYYNAAMRHIQAYRKGEKADHETGLSHLAHAICCLMFLLERNLVEAGYNEPQREGF